MIVAALSAAAACSVVVATNSPSVDLGTRPLATWTGSVASVGAAALGL